MEIEIQKEKSAKRKKNLQWALITVIFLGIAGLVIATCIYGDPAFLTWLALGFSSNILIALTVIFDLVVTAIGGIICCGVKKLFEFIFK